MMRFAPHNPTRGGATLSEVLVSILVMSIGVVTLATLFPISILRTVQATQLTNATILRYAAEAAIQVDQDIVFDPDRNGNTNEHGGRRYVFDPLGWEIMRQDFSTSEANIFGQPPPPPPPPGTSPLRRFPLFDTAPVPAPVTELAAAATVTLPDSWVFVADGFATPGGGGGAAPDRTSVTFPPTVDLTNIAHAGNSADLIQSRVIVFDVTGRFSTARRFNDITSSTISWDGFDPQLPLIPYDVDGSGTIDPGEIGLVRIETQERRYTWLLTVRNADGASAEVDVVVFFNRPFGSIEDEHFYPNVTFTQGSSTVNVAWTPGTDPDPFYRKGSFVLNTERCLWYRIQDIQNENTTAGTVDLLVAPVGRAQPNTTPTVHGGDGAMFLRGIVEVFPLGRVERDQP